ncbi:hypothetical protein BOH78_0112 [Pichia kudriavzevii]
MYCF